MNPRIDKVLKNHFGEEKALRHEYRWRIVPCMALVMLLFFPTPAFSTLTYDFVGTVLKVSEPNSLFVNVTESRIEGLKGDTEVLLKQPLPDLSSFKGKELQFDILGYDILGRPVCTVYLDGIRIHDVYYCNKYPEYCDYNSRIFPNELIGYDLYGPCYNGCRSYYGQSGCYSCNFC
jgi:hypothetical protein